MEPSRLSAAPGGLQRVRLGFGGRRDGRRREDRAAFVDETKRQRAGLDEAQRRRLNHPNAIWARWRRASKAEIGAPTRQYVGGAKLHKNGRPVYWPQDMLRRAAMALRECGSSDIFRLARVALEAAIRSEGDLIELLPPNTVAMSPLTRRTNVVGAAGYVG